MKTILITGGSGMIGRALSDFLIKREYNVIWLSRERYVKAEIPRYRWDYEKGEVDDEAIERADVIIHLAGSNLGEDSWTRLKKQRIVESRVKSAQLLFDKVKSMNKKPDAFISASAVGYYGQGISDKIFTESDPSVESDFLSRTCRKWEAEAEKFSSELGIRSVSIRTGFVVSEKSEAFRKMVTPVRFWVGAPIGSGKQYVNFIHIDDLNALYLKAIEDKTMQGPYNAVAPEYITNADFMHAIARVLKKPFFFPKVPAFFMRLVFGEVADMILGGSRVSAEKTLKTGFEFTYDTVPKAIEASIEAAKKSEQKRTGRPRR